MAGEEVGLRLRARRRREDQRPRQHPEQRGQTSHHRTMPPPRSSGGGRSRRRLRSPRALTAATIQGRVPCRTSGAPPTRPGAAITRPTSWWVTVRYARRGRNAPRRSRGRARGRQPPGSRSARPRPARISRCRCRAPARAASADHARRRPHRRLPRGGRRPPGGPRHAARAAPHRLHSPADAGDVGTSRRLAGPADTRTTTIYIAVSDARLEHTIAERTRQRNRLRRAATAD